MTLSLSQSDDRRTQSHIFTTIGKYWYRVTGLNQDLGVDEVRGLSSLDL